MSWDFSLEIMKEYDKTFPSLKWGMKNIRKTNTERFHQPQILKVVLQEKEIQYHTKYDHTKYWKALGILNMWIIHNFIYFKSMNNLHFKRNILTMCSWVYNIGGMHL